MASVDIILLSNCQSMLALPYITERTGFKGVVYGTE
jgi:integrator complex subunit 9